GVELVPLDRPGQTGREVLRDHAEHVDGVLRGAELRRVGQLEVGEVARVQPAADRRRDDVDPLVYARLADTLRTQDLVRRGVDDELERHRARSRVVAGVVARVRVDDTDVATGRACTALAPPGGC